MIIKGSVASYLATEEAKDGNSGGEVLGKESAGRVATDEDEIEKLTKLLQNVVVPHEQDTIEYEGKLITVPRNVGIVLQTVCTKMCEHFGARELPKVQLIVPQMTNLGNSEEYRSRTGPHGDRWYTDIVAKYCIADEWVMSDIVAFDNVFVDLNPIVKKDGTPAKNHTTRWINVYFPKGTINGFLSKLNADTSWYVTDSHFVVDEKQGLWSVTASVDAKVPTKFYSINMGVPSMGEDAGKIYTKCLGTLPRLALRSEFQGIYRCSCFFSLGACVVADGEGNMPLPSSGKELKLKWNLLTVKAYGAAANISPVRIERGRNVSEYM